MPKLINIIESADYTPEMKDWFWQRTNNHIDSVKKYCYRIHKALPDEYSDQLGAKHDYSKLESPEMEPYIHISWHYKMKDDGKEYEVSDQIKNDMDKATAHHVHTNSHHPEFHSPIKSDDQINRDDRDKPPAQLVDATSMPKVDVAEMVADWCAMSEEKGNTPQEWAKKNINIRWKFTDEQIKLIYDLIDLIWKV